MSRFFIALPILALLCSCQTEAQQDKLEPKRVLTVRATLPSSDDTRSYLSFGTPEYETRAQITYGNPNPDKEIFMWNEKDWVTAFNITRLSECPKGVELETTSISPDGKIAIFESPGFNSDLTIKKGDLLFVNYYETKRKMIDDTLYDDRDIFTIGVGTEENKPQYIVENPQDSSLSYMKANLKMYDIVTAVEDDRIPDLHFKHLSAIMRVTLHNETGHDLYLTDIEFRYPTKSPTAIESDIVDRNPSFFATTLYCSVETDENNEHYLMGYDTDEFYSNGSKPYTEKISTTINGKVGTSDVGESIKNGESCELYLSTVPRIGNDSYGKKLTINLIENHVTGSPYSITIDNFNTVIEAGKRYWFNLTATPAGNLVLTSQYNPDDYKTRGSTGEENGEETTPEN